MTATAAVLLIGDEILSGRTKDKNLGFIADWLTANYKGAAAQASGAPAVPAKATAQ